MVYWNGVGRPFVTMIFLTLPCTQVCGGSGIPAGRCSCGGDVADACGVCGGDGSSCAGCDGVANSGKVVDVCGVCDGGGIASGTCNCGGDVVDECGVRTKKTVHEGKGTHLGRHTYDSL